MKGIILLIFLSCSLSVLTEIVHRSYGRDGHKEFKIVKYIKGNKCDCSCACNPQTQTTQFIELTTLPTLPTEAPLTTLEEMHNEVTLKPASIDIGKIMERNLKKAKMHTITVNAQMIVQPNLKKNSTHVESTTQESVVDKESVVEKNVEVTTQENNSNTKTFNTPTESNKVSTQTEKSAQSEKVVGDITTQNNIITTQNILETREKNFDTTEKNLDTTADIRTEKIFASTQKSVLATREGNVVTDLTTQEVNVFTDLTTPEVNVFTDLTTPEVNVFTDLTTEKSLISSTDSRTKGDFDMPTTKFIETSTTISTLESSSTTQSTFATDNANSSDEVTLKASTTPTPEIETTKDTRMEDHTSTKSSPKTHSTTELIITTPESIESTTPANESTTTVKQKTDEDGKVETIKSIIKQNDEVKTTAEQISTTVIPEMTTAEVIKDIITTPTQSITQTEEPESTTNNSKTTSTMKVDEPTLKTTAKTIDAFKTTKKTPEIETSTVSSKIAKTSVISDTNSHASSATVGDVDTTFLNIESSTSVNVVTDIELTTSTNVENASTTNSAAEIESTKTAEDTTTSKIEVSTLMPFNDVKTTIDPTNIEVTIDVTTQKPKTTKKGAKKSAKTTTENPAEATTNGETVKSTIPESEFIAEELETTTLLPELSTTIEHLLSTEQTFEFTPKQPEVIPKNVAKDNGTSVEIIDNEDKPIVTAVGLEISKSNDNPKAKKISKTETLAEAENEDVTDREQESQPTTHMPTTIMISTTEEPIFTSTETITTPQESISTSTISTTDQINEKVSSTSNTFKRITPSPSTESEEAAFKIEVDTENPIDHSTELLSSTIEPITTSTFIPSTTEYIAPFDSTDVLKDIDAVIIQIDGLKSLDSDLTKEIYTLISRIRSKFEESSRPVKLTEQDQAIIQHKWSQLITKLRERLAHLHVQHNREIVARQRHLSQNNVQSTTEAGRAEATSTRMSEDVPTTPPQHILVTSVEDTAIVRSENGPIMTTENSLIMTAENSLITTTENIIITTPPPITTTEQQLTTGEEIFAKKIEDNSELSIDSVPFTVEKSLSKQNFDQATQLRRQQQKADNEHKIQIEKSLEELAEKERLHREQVERQRLHFISHHLNKGRKIEEPTMIREPERLAPDTPPAQPTTHLPHVQCEPVRTFINIFKIEDPAEWIGENCQFVKQYFPSASCSQIQNMLISCL